MLLARLRAGRLHLAGVVVLAPKLTDANAAELRAPESLLHGTTHCGLGATATNPLRDTLARFRPAYERRLASPRFVPGFDLDAELAPARRVTGRDDAGAHLEQKG